MNDINTDDRRLVRIGGIAVGFVTAREILLDGTLVYEVDPLPAWRMPPRRREEIEATPGASRERR